MSRAHEQAGFGLFQHPVSLEHRVAKALWVNPLHGEGAPGCLAIRRNALQLAMPGEHPSDRCELQFF